MNFTLERTSNPDIEPVTLAEMIQHLREFTTLPAAGQTEITKLIIASREWAEDYTGRALIDQTWKLTIMGAPRTFTDTVREPRTGYGYYGGELIWRTGEIALHKSPVLAVTAFTVVNADGTETVVPTNTYALREAASKWPRIVALNGASWSSASGQDLRVTFRAGFADRLGSPQQGAEMVPECFKQGIKLWAEANYDRDPTMMQKLMDAAAAVIKIQRANTQFA